MSQTILLVDDREANLMALEVALDDDVRVLLQATSGNDGLKMLLKNPVDLAILDVNMPEMSGYEMAEMMRLNPKTKHIPVIFVTADSASDKQSFPGEELAPVEYVYKPIDSSLLEEAVNRLCD